MSLKYFTPISGLIGGSLIGLSAATLLLFNGDILGASGLASSLVIAPKRTLTDPSQQWKISFLAAFCLTTRIYVTYFDSNALKDKRLGNDPAIPIVSELGYLVGGFLVGFGTKLGNGCTSGHGICGLARLSVRSLTGVVTFMFTGILSATACSPTKPFLRFLWDGPEKISGYLPNDKTIGLGTMLACLAGGAALPGFFREAPEGVTQRDKDEFVNQQRKTVPAVVSAALFSTGLIVSKMTISSKIYGFLDMKGLKDGTYDPTLICVMGGGLLVSFLSYQFVKGFGVFKNLNALECPLSQKDGVGHFNVPTSKVIDTNLVAGEAIFGIGWGLAGLCPGPAMVLAFAGYPNILLRWWPSFFVGSFLAEKIKLFRLKKVTPEEKK